MRRAARAIIIKDQNILLMHRNKFGHQYYALIGGGMAPGETPEQTLLREVQEEASVTLSIQRLVIIENAGSMYGFQYIYLCDYIAGEAQLSPDSIEAKITQEGKNIYTPEWVAIKDLGSLQLLPTKLKEVLISGLENGFADEPITLTIEN